jgi:DNA-binding transcriptional MerR regulator
VDRTFDTQELAERCHCSPRTIADWRYKGTGPRFYMAGRRALYREADILAWERDLAEAQDAKRAS